MSQTARFLLIPFRFQEGPWDSKVERICSQWKGTPYKLNMCHPGVGVDCVHFVAAVLDLLTACGLDDAVWRPADLERIGKELL